MKARNIIAALAAAALCSCGSEITDGTTDIDTWPLPTVEMEYPNVFTHPGVAWNQADIDRWRDIVATAHQPQYAGFEKLRDDKRSQANYKLNGPYAEIYAGDNDQLPVIMNQYADDFAAACQCAIMFAATGQKPFADKAMEVIRGYSKMTRPVFSARGAGLDHILVIGNLCVKLVYATELMHCLPGSGMTEQDFQDACDMFRRTCVGPLDDFFAITDPKNKAVGNFEASAMNCYTCLAILLDKPEMMQKAADRYLNAYCTGSIRYYVDGETGQCQESGRDQTHAQLGLGMMSMLCEVAWKQGLDLYGALDNRLLAGYEYTAKYNLGYDVPFKYMPEATGKYNWYEIDQVDKNEVLTGQRTEGRRGKFSPVYERCYNHFVRRCGLQMPYVKEVIDKVGPEGDGAPDVAHLGFGTFLYNTEGY